LVLPKSEISNLLYLGLEISMRPGVTSLTENPFEPITFAKAIDGFES
jgi:hypothetical protein